MLRLLLCTGCCLIGLGGAVLVAAPAKTVSVVDVVTLKNGRTLRGAILQRRPDRSVTIAVDRNWLQTTNPELFEQQTALEATAQKQAWTESRDRAQAWLDKLAEAPRLSAFLQQEIERLDRQLAAKKPPSADFLWIELAASQVAKVTPAHPEAQRLAVLAWNEGWVDVEKKDAATLRRELLARDIRLDGAAPDLSTRLPARPQDDLEWSARQAVVAYVYQQPLDFQGTGDLLVPTGGEQKPDLAAILPKLLQSQVDGLLSDLLAEGGGRPKPQPSEREWLAPAIATATARGVSGFRVTRLDLTPASGRVTVETRFVAKLDADQWVTVWQATETTDSQQARPELEAKIAADPQVKSVLETVKALGVVDDATFRQALRTGAATMAAQQSADQNFHAFTDRYSRSLDRPKLFLPAP